MHGIRVRRSLPHHPLAAVCAPIGAGAEPGRSRSDGRGRAMLDADAGFPAGGPADAGAPGPAMDAALSTHHRIAGLRANRRSRGCAASSAGPCRPAPLVAGASSTTTPRACRPSCSRPSPRSPASMPTPALRAGAPLALGQDPGAAGAVAPVGRQGRLGRLRRLVPGAPRRGAFVSGLDAGAEGARGPCSACRE